MNDKRFDAAAGRYMSEPEALTDEDIEVLATVDDQLGRSADIRRKRAQLKASEVRHRAAMGEAPAKKDRYAEMAEAVVATVMLALAKPRQSIKSLEADRATLTSEIELLKTRVLELEAERATREVVTHGG